MNIELLQRVKAAILAEPEHFRMDTWTCGTAHCIAGWALKLTGREIANPQASPELQRMTDGITPLRAASEVLEMELHEAELLFYDSCWPDDLQERYEHQRYQGEEGYAERAHIAAEAIDRFQSNSDEFGDQGDGDDWEIEDDDF